MKIFGAMYSPCRARHFSCLNRRQITHGCEGIEEENYSFHGKLEKIKRKIKKEKNGCQKAAKKSAKIYIGIKNG